MYHGCDLIVKGLVIVLVVNASIIKENIFLQIYIPAKHPVPQYAHKLF